MLYFQHEIFAVLLFAIGGVNLLENGLARMPPMGWMSWGYYMCGVDCERNPAKCLDEKLILSVADAFFEEGYQEAGYEYIIIDDCWSEKERDEDGRLVPDRKRFPNGMKYIADYIHKRGLKFGMYTNVAEVTCMHYPGSREHFEIDAQTFASWDVDYIKVDGCFVPPESLNTAYIEFGTYLNLTGRPMVYSCSWPYYMQFIYKKKPNLPAVSATCNLWRNFHDVSLQWAAVVNIAKHYTLNYKSYSPHHGPGHWNDPDMLIVGTGVLTASQSRAQLVVHVMLSAPLLLSCDMRSLTAEDKELLLNMELMAVAQDPLGIMAAPYGLGNHITLWVKPHLPKKGSNYISYSFALVNYEPRNYTVAFTPGHYGLNYTDGYTVMNVFTMDFLWNITLHDSITVDVPANDAVMYSMFPL